MRVRVFLLDWDTIGQNYLKDITFSSQAQFFLHFYVFYKSKELPSKLLPQFRFLHVPKKASIAPLDSDDLESIAAKLIAKNPRVRIQEKKDVILVSSEPYACFAPLIEILNNEKMDFKFVTTEEFTALDEFSIKCMKCRMIFRDKKECKKHNDRFCGFFDGCLTDRNKGKVGFSSQVSDFTERMEDADKCERCMANCVLTYCPHRSRKEDMKMVHKTTYVGKTHPCWSKYDNNEFSAHFFYGYDVLPCLAVTGCPRTFRTLQEQAHHHTTEHGCQKPYVCIVCYKLLKFTCFETDNELLFHGKLEGHCEPDFSFA